MDLFKGIGDFFGGLFGRKKEKRKEDQPPHAQVNTQQSEQPAVALPQRQAGANQSQGGGGGIEGDDIVRRPISPTAQFNQMRRSGIGYDTARKKVAETERLARIKQQQKEAEARQKHDVERQEHISNVQQTIDAISNSSVSQSQKDTVKQRGEELIKKLNYVKDLNNQHYKDFWHKDAERFSGIIDRIATANKLADSVYSKTGDANKAKQAYDQQIQHSEEITTLEDKEKGYRDTARAIATPTQPLRDVTKSVLRYGTKLGTEGLEFIGNVTDNKALANASRQAQQSMDEAFFNKFDTEYDNQVLKNVTEGVTSLGMDLVTGKAITKGLQQVGALGKITSSASKAQQFLSKQGKVSSLVGKGIQASLGTPQAISSTAVALTRHYPSNYNELYNHARGKGLSHSEANVMAHGNAIINSAIEKANLDMGEWFKVGNKTATLITRAAGEGAEEWLQTMSSYGIKNLYSEVDWKKAREEAKMSGLMGAAVGGIASGLETAYIKTIKPKIDAEINHKLDPKQFPVENALAKVAIKRQTLATATDAEFIERAINLAEENDASRNPALVKDGNFANSAYDPTRQEVFSYNNRDVADIQQVYVKHGDDFYDRLSNKQRAIYESLLDKAQKDQEGRYKDPITGSEWIDKVIETPAGKLVEIEGDPLKGVPIQRIPAKVRQVIKERFQGNEYNIGDTDQTARVTARSKNELAYQQTKMSNEQYKTKALSSHQLDELMQSMQNVHTAKNKKDISKPDVLSYTYGDVTVKIGDKFYDARVNIENWKSGKSIIYDISKIKETPPQRQTLLMGGGVHDSILSQDRDFVNNEAEQDVKYKISDEKPLIAAHSKDISVIKRMLDEAGAIPKPSFAYTKPSEFAPYGGYNAVITLKDPIGYAKTADKFIGDGRTPMLSKLDPNTPLDLATMENELTSHFGFSADAIPTQSLEAIRNFTNRPDVKNINEDKHRGISYSEVKGRSVTADDIDTLFYDETDVKTAQVAKELHDKYGFNIQPFNNTDRGNVRPLLSGNDLDRLKFQKQSENGSQQVNPDSQQKVVLDIEATAERLKERLKHTTGDDNIVFETFVDEMKKDIKGYYDRKTDTVHLADLAESTLNHEIIHKVLMRDTPTRQKVMSEMAKRYDMQALMDEYNSYGYGVNAENGKELVVTSARDRRTVIEEKLADEFNKYLEQRNKGRANYYAEKVGLSQTIRQWFEKIIRDFNELFAQKDVITQFYKDVDSGKFRNMQSEYLIRENLRGVHQQHGDDFTSHLTNQQLQDYNKLVSYAPRNKAGFYLDPITQKQSADPETQRQIEAQMAQIENMSGAYKISQDNNGYYVEIEKNIFDGVSIKDRAKVLRQYIQQNLQGNSYELNFGADGEARITRVSTNKIANPHQRVATINQKGSMISELPDMLTISKKTGFSPDKKAHSFARDGFEYRSSRVKIGEDIFTVNLNVGINNDGKVLYEINNIKKEPHNSQGLFRGGSYDSSIAQDGDDVKMKLRETGDKASSEYDVNENTYVTTNTSYTSSGFGKEYINIGKGYSIPNVPMYVLEGIDGALGYGPPRIKEIVRAKDWLEKHGLGLDVRNASIVVTDPDLAKAKSMPTPWNPNREAILAERRSSSLKPSSSQSTSKGQEQDIHQNELVHKPIVDDTARQDEGWSDYDQELSDLVARATDLNHLKGKAYDKLYRQLEQEKIALDKKYGIKSKPQAQSENSEELEVLKSEAEQNKAIEKGKEDLVRDPQSGILQRVNTETGEVMSEVQDDIDLYDRKQKAEELLSRAILEVNPTFTPSELINQTSEMFDLPADYTEQMIKNKAKLLGYDMNEEGFIPESPVGNTHLEVLGDPKMTQEEKLNKLDEITKKLEADYKVGRYDKPNGIVWATNKQGTIERVVYVDNQGKQQYYDRFRDNPQSTWQEILRSPAPVKNVKNDASEIHKIITNDQLAQMADSAFAKDDVVQLIWKMADEATGGTTLLQTHEANGKYETLRYNPTVHYIEGGFVRSRKTDEILGNYLEVDANGIRVQTGRNMAIIDLDFSKLTPGVKPGVFNQTERVIEAVTKDPQTRERLRELLVYPTREAEANMKTEAKQIETDLEAFRKRFKKSLGFIRGHLYKQMQQDAVYYIEPDKQEAKAKGGTEMVRHERLDSFRKKYGQQAADALVDYDKWMRGVYDNLLARINQTRVAKGLAPIERRKNYITHIQELTGGIGRVYQSMRAGIMGDSEALNHRQGLPEQIAGLTSEFRPDSKYNPYLQHRRGDIKPKDPFTPVGVYANLALHNIHLTKPTMMFRSLEMALRAGGEMRDMSIGKISESAEDNFLKVKVNGQDGFVQWLQEHGNILSGKTGMIDRFVMDKFKLGRPMLSTVKSLQRISGQAAIMGNLRSAIAQTVTLAPAMGTNGPLNMFMGLVQRLGDARKSDKIWQQSDFIRERYTDVKNLTRQAGFTQKIADTLGIPMQVIEEQVVRTVWHGAYAKATRTQKLGGVQAIRYADSLTSKIATGRSIGDTAHVYQNTASGAPLMYTREVTENFKNFFKDQTPVGKVMTLISYALMGLASKELLGDDIAFNPIDFLGKIKDQLDNHDSDTVTKLIEVAKISNGTFVDNLPVARLALGVVPENFRNMIVSGQTDIGRYGTSLPFFTPLDRGARAIQAIKDEQPIKAMQQAVGIMPAGSQIKKTWEGLEAVNQGYTTNSKGRPQTAVNNDAWNMVRGALFGKNALKEQREYNQSLDSGEKPKAVGKLKELQSDFNTDKKLKEYGVKNISDWTPTGDSNQDKEIAKLLIRKELGAEDYRIANMSQQDRKKAIANRTLTKAKLDAVDNKANELRRKYNLDQKNVRESYQTKLDALKLDQAYYNEVGYDNEIDRYSLEQAVEVAELKLRKSKTDDKPVLVAYDRLSIRGLKKFTKDDLRRYSSSQQNPQEFWNRLLSLDKEIGAITGKYKLHDSKGRADTLVKSSKSGGRKGGVVSTPTISVGQILSRGGSSLKSAPKYTKGSVSYQASSDSYRAISSRPRNLKIPRLTRK